MNSITKLFLLFSVTIFASSHINATHKQISTSQLEEVSLPSIKIAAPFQTMAKTNATKPVGSKECSVSNTSNTKKEVLEGLADRPQEMRSNKVPLNSQSKQSSIGIEKQDLPAQP